MQFYKASQSLLFYRGRSPWKLVLNRHPTPDQVKFQIQAEGSVGKNKLEGKAFMKTSFVRSYHDVNKFILSV